MKHMKKVLAVLLTCLLVLGMCTTAFASKSSEGGSVVPFVPIDDGSNTGVEDDDEVLIDKQYGQNGEDKGYVDQGVADTTGTAAAAGVENSDIYTYVYDTGEIHLKSWKVFDGQYSGYIPVDGITPSSNVVVLLYDTVTGKWVNVTGTIENGKIWCTFNHFGPIMILMDEATGGDVVPDNPDEPDTPDNPNNNNNGGGNGSNGNGSNGSSNGGSSSNGSSSSSSSTSSTVAPKTGELPIMPILGVTAACAAAGIIVISSKRKEA